MDYTKGGRGKKAPYKSVVCRIPYPLTGIVDALVERFKSLIDTGEDKYLEDTTELWFRLINQELVTSKNQELTKEEAIEQANKILGQKKSARISLQKLLQVIYGGDVTLQ